MTEAQGPMHEPTRGRTPRGLNHFGLPYENPVTAPAEPRTDADPASIQREIVAENDQPVSPGIGAGAQEEPHSLRPARTVVSIMQTGPSTWVHELSDGTFLTNELVIMDNTIQSGSLSLSEITALPQRVPRPAPSRARVFATRVGNTLRGLKQG